jgi:hypothetical protein
MGLAAPALIAIMLVPVVTGTAPAAKAAQAADAQAAAASPDEYDDLTIADFCNNAGACGAATLWLDTLNGDMHAELNSTGLADDPHPPIPGSEVTLQTSGYDDFRNVPYTWRAWVPSSGSQQWYANTQDVSYAYPGANWWWRACGYIGSASMCTVNVKVTYSVADGWQFEYN